MTCPSSELHDIERAVRAALPSTPLTRRAADSGGADRSRFFVGTSRSSEGR